MPIYETFDKRKRNAMNAGKPITYRDDILPQAFRVQVIHIWRRAIGNPFGDGGRGLINPQLTDIKNLWWSHIHGTLAEAFGVFELAPDLSRTHGIMERCEHFLLRHEDIDQALSLIEFTFRLIDNEIRHSDIHWSLLQIWQEPDDAISDLNARFREHAIGYQFQGGQIIPVNSQYLHSETVEPAISLLHDGNFAGSLEEFMVAHEHYRKGNYKEAITNAGSALESTLKTICDRRGWSYAPRATALNLIETVFSNGLVPPELMSHFSGLRSALESGVPTLRNQAGRGAHGQGSGTIEVPDYLAAYCLHLTAANIVFLVEAHKAKP